jgi:hypothetical protein
LFEGRVKAPVSTKREEKHELAELHELDLAAQEMMELVLETQN